MTDEVMNALLDAANLEVGHLRRQLRMLYDSVISYRQVMDGYRYGLEEADDSCPSKGDVRDADLKLQQTLDLIRSFAKN